MKYKRSSLKRKSTASWKVVMIGILSVIVGLLGYIATHVTYLAVFALYYFVTAIIVVIILGRMRLLKFFYWMISNTVCGNFCGNSVQKNMKALMAQQLVFFAKTDQLHTLGKAVEYVRDNESTSWLKIVHVYKSEDKIPKNMELHVQMLDKMYPKMRIDLVRDKTEIVQLEILFIFFRKRLMSFPKENEQDFQLNHLILFRYL